MFFEMFHVTSVNSEHFTVQNHAEKENTAKFFDYIDMISHFLELPKIV